MKAEGTAGFKGVLETKVNRPWWRGFTVPFLLLGQGKYREFLNSVGLMWLNRLINYFRSIWL